MFGLDFAMAGTLLTLAAAKQQVAVNQCPHVKAAEINVVPSTADIVYDYTKTLKQLQSTKVDTINPYGFHGVTMTQGYMDGEIRIKPSIKLGNKSDPRTGMFCIWYDRVDIPIQITPRIVIAQEVFQDQCMRKAVIEHEMKHVTADRKIVNKYAKSMGQKIYAAMAERGFRAEPVPGEHAQAMADRMQQLVSQVIEHEYKRMDLDRIEAQRAIDNLEEYNSVGDECTEYKAKMSAIANSKSSSKSGKSKSGNR